MPRKFIYIPVSVLISALFLKLLHAQIVGTTFEVDLLWFIPTVFREIEGLSWVKLIAYIFRLSNTWVDVLMLKAYAVFTLLLFGPLAKDFVFVSIFFHFCCSVLISLISKKLGLGSRVSFLSGMMYLTLFTHFASYTWPMDFQHLILVFFILLGFDFYLRVNRRIDDGGNYRLLFASFLLVNLIASFCRATILILPAMILTHILICAKDNRERIRRYNIFIPLFMVYMIYPVITLVAGDLRFKNIFNMYGSLFVNSGTSPTSFYDLSTLTKFSIAFSLGVLSLFIFRAVLVMRDKHNFGKALKWISIIGAAFLAVILIKSGGFRRLLIPYNLLVPFAGILASFLQPIKNALLINPARPYHFVPLQISPLTLLLSVLVIGIFIMNFGRKNKALAVLATFYMIDLIYLYLWNPIRSRYFIYLSPIFCIAFCTVFDYAYTYMTRHMRLKVVAKELILVLIFLSLCIPNVLAIKLALVRGRMANNFVTYNYLRAADIIKKDLTKIEGVRAIEKKELYINKFMPLTFTHAHTFANSDSYNDNIRFVFMQAFDNASLEVKLNQTQQEGRGDKEGYLLDGYMVKNADGEDISEFSQIFKRAQKKLRANRYQEAAILFEEAIDESPFLFDYALSGLRLEDLEWITNGQDMRSWIDEIECHYAIDYAKKEADRVRHISAIMKREIDEYIQCLFFTSFLEYTSGRLDESRYRFFQIRFLEDDYDKLYPWLGDLPLVKSDRKISAFLDGIDSCSLYDKPHNYRDRYKFGKFLTRLISTK
ncbi:MAG: hypothetical protein HQ593_03260 [Candidatus Omnitrophica bacterium]|nr:hypothetical protein [Candidatus Omnitrophota bacterium]